MTSKYAALPDLVSSPLYSPYLMGENFATKWIDLQDASQDVYETPDLVEDVSTLPVCFSPFPLATLPFFLPLLSVRSW